MAPGFVGLGALAGEAVAVLGSLLKHVECVGHKPKLVLRNGQAVFDAFHGGEFCEDGGQMQPHWPTLPALPRVKSCRPDVGREVTGILLVRVGIAAGGKDAARVLPCLPLPVPMETKLRQLLPNPGCRCGLELNPNPLADNLGKAVNVGQRSKQAVQHRRCRKRPVLQPLL